MSSIREQGTGRIASSKVRESQRDELTEQALNWIAARETPELYLCLSETLKLGRGHVELLEEDGLLVRIDRNGAVLAAPLTENAAREMRDLVHDAPIIGLTDARLAEAIAPGTGYGTYTLWHYPARTPVELPERNRLDFRLLDGTYAETVADQYLTMPRADTVQHVCAGLVWGGFDAADELVGFIGEHDESSMGMLEVYPAHRKHGYATQLEGSQVNRFLKAGRTPFCQVAVGNAASEALQCRLGLVQVPGTQCWIEFRDR